VSASDAHSQGCSSSNYARPNGTRAQGPASPGIWVRARLSRLRPIHSIPILLALSLFLAVSVLLARWLSVENAERDEVLAVLVAQAQGDAQGMLRKLGGCAAEPPCAAAVHLDAARLRRSGSVKILSLKSSTAYSLGGAVGKTRVAWTVIGRLPVVQCVRVKRTGNALSGISVQLESIGPPIPGEADC
jgi:hypothetical protein